MGSFSPGFLRVGGAAGASLFWPLMMSEAVRRASAPTAAVGAFTAAGYVGWVAGAPLVGWVADTWGLEWGLLVLAAASLSIVLLAASVWRPVAPEPPSDPPRRAECREPA